MVARRDVALVRETIEELRGRGQVERAEAVETMLSIALARPGARSVAEGYLTTGQAGKLIGVSAQTIKNWVAAGHVQAMRLGSRVLIDRQSLLDYLGALPRRRVPWDDLTPEPSQRTLQLAEAASPPEKLARLESLHEKLEEGHHLTRAERAEMVRLEHEVNTAATDALERLIESGQN